jgi:hypothetical protein
LISTQDGLHKLLQCYPSELTMFELVSLDHIAIKQCCKVGPNAFCWEYVYRVLHRYSNFNPSACIPHHAVWGAGLPSDASR